MNVNIGRGRNPIAITVDMDSKGAIKNIKKLTGSIAGIGVASAASLLGVAALGGAMGVAAAAASKHAARLELVQNKTRIVFGEQLPIIQEWSRNTAQSFGLTAINLEGMAAGFQDLLIPMGFTREAAAGMTMDVVGLAGAMSEWSAGTRTVEDTTRILARAMLGEREMLKDLGVDIRELDIKQRLMAKGQEDLTGNFLKQARAVATMEMIFERSKDAQTGFAQGTDSLTRKQRELSARFHEMVQEIQIALLPEFKNLVDRITNEVIPKIEKDLMPILRDLVKGIGEHLPTAIDNAIHFMTMLQTGFSNTRHAAGLLKTTFEDLGAGVDDFKTNLLKVAIPMTGLAILMGPSGALAAAALITAGSLAFVSSKLIDMAVDAFEASKALADQRRMLDEANSAYQDVEIEELTEKMKNAALTTRDLNDGFDEGKEKTDKWADAVEHLSRKMGRLTAAQYAAEIAASILAEKGLGTSDAALQEFIDLSMKRLRKLVGQESELERLKNQLLEAAGLDMSGKGGRGESTFTGFATGNFAGIPHAQVQKLKESAIKMDEVAQGMAHFALDLDAFMEPIAGAGTNLGTIGVTARFPKANEMMPGTPNAIANAIDDLFVGIVEEFNLPEHAAQSLAESMMKQATQQEIFQFGPALRGNLPGATSAGLPDPISDPAAFAAAAPKEQVPVPKVDVTINAGIVPDMQEAGNLVAQAFSQSDLYRSGAVTLGG
jgi:hypothetical protein